MSREVGRNAALLPPGCRMKIRIVDNHEAFEMPGRTCNRLNLSNLRCNRVSGHYGVITIMLSWLTPCRSHAPRQMSDLRNSQQFDRSIPLHLPQDSPAPQKKIHLLCVRLAARHILPSIALPFLIPAHGGWVTVAGITPVPTFFRADVRLGRQVRHHTATNAASPRCFNRRVRVNCH